MNTIKSLPDLRILEALDVLLTEKNVSNAAAIVGLSQPAMSHSLARLRLIFSDPLLVRSGNDLVPTKRALELHAEVQHLLFLAKQLVAPANVEFDPATSTAQIRVISTAFSGSIIAPYVMAKCEKEAPNVSISFSMRSGKATISEMESGKIDFQLGWWDHPPKNLRQKALLSEALVTIVANNHPLAKVPISEWFFKVRHARVDGDGSSFSNTIVDAEAKNRDEQVIVGFTAPHVFAMADAVARTRMLGVVSQRIGKQLASQYDVSVLPFPFEAPNFRVSLYWHERAHMWPLHRWFRNIVSESLRLD